MRALFVRAFFSTGFVAISLVASGLFAVACVQGQQTSEVHDNCKIRDCGPVSGGNTEAAPDDDDAFFDDDTGLLDVGDSTTEDSGVDAAKDASSAADSAAATEATVDATPDAPCTVPTGKTCSTVPQCGCSTGQCEVTADDGTRSCVAIGAKKLNEPCTDFGQCAAGLSCGLFGLCVPFCNVTADCPSSSMDCRAAQTTTDAGVVDIPDYKTCETSCDPINPAKNCGSASCAFYDATSTVCVAAGAGTTTASCKTGACAAGYTCVNDADCHRWCRVGFAGDCPGGKACTTFSDHPKLGGVEFGYCAY